MFTPHPVDDPPATLRHTDTLPCPAATSHLPPPSPLGGICPGCKAGYDIGLFDALAWGRDPVRHACGALLYHPAPPPVMPLVVGVFRLRRSSARRAA